MFPVLQGILAVIVPKLGAKGVRKQAQSPTPPPPHPPCRCSVSEVSGAGFGHRLEARSVVESLPCLKKAS